MIGLEEESNYTEAEILHTYKRTKEDLELLDSYLAKFTDIFLSKSD